MQRSICNMLMYLNTKEGGGMTAYCWICVCCKACPGIPQLNVTSVGYLFLRISKLEQSTTVS